MIAKQIIYPIRYANALFGKSHAQSESERFRKALAEILGDGIDLMPLGRARMGIYLLVRPAIKGPRRKVILSPYTIPDVVNMVVLAGGEPVFVDFAARSTNVDIDHLQDLMGNDVASVLLTHYHVNQNQLGVIRALCEKRGVLLFEDCALSLSGQFDGKHVGTESDGAILSLSGFKFLNYFWGGCVFSKHSSVIHALEVEASEWPSLRWWDYFPQVVKTVQYDFLTRKPLFDCAVFPYIKIRQRRSAEAVNLTPPRIETLSIDKTLMSFPSESAFFEWNAKINRLNGYLEHRRNIASIYDQYLDGKMVSLETTESVKSGSCFVNYPIYVGQSVRNRIYKELILDGYDVGTSLYPNCNNHSKFMAAEGKSSNVEDLVRSTITLPTHPRVDEQYAHALGEIVRARLKVS